MKHLDKLNPEQKEAVEFFEGPLLVIAGAGSGKTRVVTCRIAHLIEIGIPPSQILALTFTNKAAEEMKERVRQLTQCNVMICTFHSLGARILRESISALGYGRHFNIYDEDDSEKLLKTCLSELNLESILDVKTTRTMISHAKNRMITPENLEKSDHPHREDKFFATIYSHYQAKLAEYSAVDFDDLLFLTVRLFQEHPDVLTRYQQRWSFLLIDEYQDTNTAQYTIVRHLIEKTHNLCVVGDPDQSIYSWRGANIQNILNFEKDYPGAKIIRLEQNYRSHTHILDAANALIAHNERRYDKKLWSALDPGEKIKLFAADDEIGEAQFIADKMAYHHVHDSIPLTQMVVFYRTNFQSRAFEDVLLNKRIPYIIVGGISFYHRREVKDILAYLRIILSGADYISFARTINVPKRGLGETTIEKIRLASSQENRTIFSYCEALVDQTPLQHPVKLSAKQFDGLKDYVRIIRLLQQQANQVPLKDLVAMTIEQSHCMDVLMQDEETFEERKSNLEELVNKAAEWESYHQDSTLENFLEELALKSSLDETDAGQERVNLMTIHNGKGLEFSVAFLAGLEEDLFPHANARESDNALEEERRLCYVGITRAKQLLYVTYVQRRFLWGTRRSQRPSRFIKEIPLQYMEKISFSRARAFVKPKIIEPKEDDFIEEIDQTLSQENEFFVGDSIFHREFGIGVIRNIAHNSVGLTYKIHFVNDDKEKTLVAKYAKLNRI